jgi:hypothetical protein
MQSKTYEPCALYGIKELLAYASATFLVQPGPLQLKDCTSAYRIEVRCKAAIAMLRHCGRVQMSHFFSEQQLTAVPVNDGPGVLNIGRYAMRVLQRIAEPLKSYVFVMLHQCTFHQGLP